MSGRPFMMLRALWRMATQGLAVLFAPLVWLARPLLKLGSFMSLGRLFGKRSAWKTEPLGMSSQALDSGLFKPMDVQRASPMLVLRPVNPLFVVFSLFMALSFNLLPWGNWVWVPDLLMVVILFWSYREPRMVSLGVAFSLGVLMDVHNGAVLGQHSLSYCIVAYAGVLLSRRLPSFGLFNQSAQVWPVFFVAQLLSVGVSVFFGEKFLGWWILMLSPTIATLCWPFVTGALLYPQRRPLDIDQNRPL